MATLYKEKTGSWSIRFIDEHKKRKSVCLPKKYFEKTANEVMDIIEKLIECQNNDQKPGKRVMTWLETTDNEIRDKLEKVGLIEQSRRLTLSQLWDEYMAEDRDYKPSTIEKYEAVRKQFFAFFKEDDLIESLTKDSLKKWQKFLLQTYKTPHGELLAPTTVTGSIAKIKAICRWATDEMELFEKNPAISLKGCGYVNKERSFEIDRSMYGKLLVECRTQEQRTILAFARIGGLRIPSEIARLTWADVLWERDRFFVESPKTERYKGKEGRFVPLFPELRKELEKLYFADEATGRDDRVFPNRRSDSNLRSLFEDVQKRAGIVPIDKFFINCRASRSTEVFDEYGAFLESQWIGHSTQVAMRHYCQVRDIDFAAAAGKDRPENPKYQDLQALAKNSTGTNSGALVRNG